MGIEIPKLMKLKFVLFIDVFNEQSWKWILKWLLLCLWIFKFVQITFKEIWRGTKKSQISIWRILEDLQWPVFEKIRTLLPMIQNEKLPIRRFQNHFCNQNSTKSKLQKKFRIFWGFLNVLRNLGKFYGQSLRRQWKRNASFTTIKSWSTLEIEDNYGTNLKSF